MIDVSPGKIAGVKLIRPAAQHDLRGTFVKTMQTEIFSKHGIPMQYAEQYYSVSKNNVLRGLHFQTPPHDHYKLVTCIAGEAFDVVVDLRRGSRTYGQHESFELMARAATASSFPRVARTAFTSDLKAQLCSITSARFMRLPTTRAFAGIRSACRGPAESGYSDRDAGLVAFAEFNTPF